MLRKTSRFSNSQLERAKLFLVDDVDYLKPSKASFFKPLAGKDKIPTDNKYKSMSLIQPKCVIILVSNFPPQHFSVLREEAILNKINKVELRKEDQVDPDERMTNFENECLQYASEIINWALHAPLDLSVKIIRGEFWSRYNKYEAQQKGFDTFGLTNFIEESLMAQPYNSEVKGIGFIPGNEVAAAVKQYIDVSSDGELRNLYESLPEKRRMKELQVAICRCLYQEFDYKEAEVIRFTRAGVYTHRPAGLKNLTIFNPKGNAADTTPLRVKKETDLNAELPDWFEADTEIRSVLGFNREP